MTPSSEKELSELLQFANGPVDVIGGIFTTPRENFDSCNPATGAVLAKLSSATKADIDHAESQMTDLLRAAEAAD